METKLTILIAHCRYRQRGGEDTAVENEIRLLKKYGHRVLYYERDNSVSFLPHSVFFNLKVYSDIRKIIKKERIDIVHVHNTWMSMSRSVFYAAESMGVPAVQTLHNFRMICPNAVLCRNGAVCEACLDKGVREGVRNRCYRDSFVFTAVCAAETAVHKKSGILGRINYICLSEFNKEKILQINEHEGLVIDPEKVYVKPNFVWEGKVLTDDGRSGFIFAGRLSDEKGIRVLIRAWEILGKEAPRLLIYGSGDLEGWCKNEIEGKGLNAIMMGEASHEELMRALGRSEALIFPSVCYEGFPIAVIEAFSMGAPVISSDIGNGKQFIKNGRNGSLFECGSPGDLARTVRDLTEKRAVYNENDIVIPSICTPEENYRILEKIYSRIISGSPL